MKNKVIILIEQIIAYFVCYTNSVYILLSSFALPTHGLGSTIALIPAAEVTQYTDHRPAATFHLTGVSDQGVVLRHGDGPAGVDRYGARDVWVFPDNGMFYMHYDAEGSDGWLCNLATSIDLRHWRKQGPVLALGPPGSIDAGSASYCTTYYESAVWHMFYLGTPNTTPAPDRVPQFPYQTLEAVSSSPSGPWRKTAMKPPFEAVPGTYYGVTASPGQIVRQGSDYLQFFSAAALDRNGKVYRTISIARASSLDEAWHVDRMPALPVTEQIENSAIYHQADGTWFLFTNHVGISADGREYTDAIWMYWTRNPSKWLPADKALVLDGASSSWSKLIIGLPSTVLTADGKLALFYDGLQANVFPARARVHMNRDIGLALIQLPIKLPEN